MREFSVSVKIAVFDQQIFRLPNQSQSIAGGIQDTVGNLDVVPGTAGDGIIAGLDFTLIDLNVVSRPKMNSVIPLFDLQFAAADIVDFLEKDAVI